MIESDNDNTFMQVSGDKTPAPFSTDNEICKGCGVNISELDVSDECLDCPVCLTDREIAGEFTILSSNNHVSYRCNRKYVEVCYDSGDSAKLTWLEVFDLVTHCKNGERTTPHVKRILDVNKSGPEIAAVNVFIRAVNHGLVPEARIADLILESRHDSTMAESTDDEDAEYKPMLSDVVNTRADYDAGTVGNW